MRLFRDPYYIKEAAFSEAINIIVEKRGGVWQVKDEYAGWAATQSEVSEDVLTGNFSMAQPDRAPAVQVMVPRAIPHKRKQVTSSSFPSPESSWMVLIVGQPSELAGSAKKSAIATRSLDVSVLVVMAS